MAGEPLIASSSRGRAALAAVLVAVMLTGCSVAASGPTPKSNSVMCLDALALPVTSGAQAFIDPDRLSGLRTQALAVLDAEAPDAEVTGAAHDVARKMIIVVDTVEGLDPDAGLGLLGSGLDALSTLGQPLSDLADAHAALLEACLKVDATSSPSTTSI